MDRISELERKYVEEALRNKFRASCNSMFNGRLKGKFARLFRVKNAIAHVNGTATLHTALAALGVGLGDEVIVPPLTMSSTAISVLQNNAIPDLFQRKHGDSFYASWKLSYREPLFINQVQRQTGIWQDFSKELCPNADYLQARMIQLKTNCWNFTEAERQAEILQKTIGEFSGGNG